MAFHDVLYEIKYEFINSIYHENVKHNFVIFGGKKMLFFFKFNYGLHWRHKRHRIPDMTCWETRDTEETLMACGPDSIKRLEQKCYGECLDSEGATSTKLVLEVNLESFLVQTYW